MKASLDQADFFGLGAATSAPKPETSSKTPAAEAARSKDERTSNPSAVREFLHGSSAGAAGKAKHRSHLGMDLPKWDTADEGAVKQQAVFSRSVIK